MKPNERPTVAQFISSKIKECGKSQKEIAEACSWPKPNMVTMIKQGKSKLPLDKIGPLATVLGVEPVYLFWLTMQEYFPETLRAIEFSIRGVMLTDHEKEIIETYRDLTHGIDQNVEIRVGDDKGRVYVSGGQTLERHIPAKPTKAKLAAAESVDREFGQAIGS